MNVAGAQKLAQNPSWVETMCPAALEFVCYRSCLRAALGPCACAVRGELGEPETTGQGVHGHLAMFRLVCKGEGDSPLCLSQTKQKVLRDWNLSGRTFLSFFLPNMTL